MLNSSEEKVKYLANIVFIARADNKITQEESNAIEEIQKNIKAKKTELNKAYELAENQNYQIELVGNYSDKIRNLEDIVYLSLSDGEFDELKRKVLLEIAKNIFLTNEQLNLIIYDVKNVIALKNENLICSKCNTEIPNNAKFCPNCGNSIITSVESKSVNLSYEIPPIGISIEFAESTSAGFADAVKQQQLAPINNTCLKAKKTWYLASWNTADVTVALELVKNLKGMRNRKIYIDGVESKWEDVFGFTWCASQRDTAYKPTEYCFGIDEKRFNIWGCKAIRMEWTEWADWFSYGTFKKSGLLQKQVIFVFDKERIKHEIKTNVFSSRYCPHIRFNLIDAIVEALPDEVNLSNNGSWSYKKDYSESPGSIKVKTKIVDDGYTYMDEFYTSGVTPKSISVGIEILKKALRTIDVNETEIKEILEFKG